MIKYSKERYTEEFDEGSQLLWPSEQEDKVTRKFYRDLSHFSKNKKHKKIDSNLIKQLIKLIFMRGSSPVNK
tara:strand:- start:22 stop:237 length:216 start_codon:yes stop_codon:yes gene_type:complete